MSLLLYRNSQEKIHVGHSMGLKKVPNRLKSVHIRHTIAWHATEHKSNADAKETEHGA